MGFANSLHGTDKIRRMLPMSKKKVAVDPQVWTGEETVPSARWTRRRIGDVF